MKIAYYIDSIIPTRRANMVHVMKMCQAFSDLGYEVTLMCDADQKNLDFNTIRKQYAVSKKFEICTVFRPKILNKYGHRFAAYYGAYKKSKIKMQYDYAYSRSAATLYFLRKRERFIYESHMEPDFINKKIEYKVLKSKNCVGLVVISQELKLRYLEIFPFLTPDFITVLHDAADIPEIDFNEKAPLHGNREDIKIGYIGHLYPGKCMETLIPLATKCPQYQFHVVGGTDEWIAYWKAKVDKNSIKNLLFYGYVENSNIGRYYNSFDIAILPFSREISIGKNKNTDIGKWISPLKLFEAMAYEKPIIVSRLATIEEVMEDGRDCIMVDPDNIDQWAEKLVKLCEDSELQNRIGSAAFKKLAIEYTWINRAKKAVALFK